MRYTLGLNFPAGASTIVRASISLAVLATFLAIAAPVRAEPWWPINSSHQQSYQDAYNALLADPSNIALLANFAKEASRIGNYEAAIGALESILIQNPGLHRVRVELGVMYFRVGAYEVSRYHLERAIASGTLPEKVERRARAYLETDDDRLDGTRFSGYISAGLRWDSNPLFITEEDEIFGVDDTGDTIIGPSDIQPDSDFAGFLQGHVLWREDLGNQYGDTWDSTATTYWRWQFEEGNADIGYVKVTSGPRLSIAPGEVDHARVRPYFIGTFSLVDNDFSNGTAGLGATLYKRFDTWITPYVKAEVRRRFADDNDYNGWLVDTRVGVSMALTEDLLVGFGGRFLLTDANADYRSSTAFGVFANLSYRYDAPFEITAFPWELSLHGEYRHENYDGVVPSIGSGLDRTDNEYRVVARNTVGLSSSWFLYVEGGFKIQDSTVPNYEADNQYVAVGATWRF